MPLRRRVFLKSGAFAMLGVGSGIFGLPVFLTRAAEVARSRRKTLVVVFQRGAADGLNIVVPHGESAYYALRPSISVPRPQRGKDDTALELDEFFGFHPRMQSLKKLYDRRQLAVVTAAGSPDATRSHFDAQDFMETGTPGVKSTADGWLNRYLRIRADAEGHLPAEDVSRFRGVSLTQQMPRILEGAAPALAVPDLVRFGIREGRTSQVMRGGLQQLFAASGDSVLAPTAAEAFEAIDELQAADPTRYNPANGARYPRGPFGASLRQIAQLIKSDMGVEVAFAEIGGWDHHLNEGGIQGALARKLPEFDGGLGAFVQDLGDRMEDVLIVTLSEFGRSAKENGTRGTDHGHANSMLLIGGSVRGGKVYGDWPGLEPEQLYEGRDLALTTDFRTVLSRALRHHLKADSLAGVFPGFSDGAVGVEDAAAQRLDRLFG